MTLKTVFLSSTTRDLQKYRDAVRDGINLMEGYHCYGMENFGARDRPPEHFCREKVKESDVVICIIGHLYGSCPQDTDNSYTEIEYDAAVEGAIPRLVFVAPEDFLAPVNLSEGPEKQRKQEAFRARIDTERVRVSFDSPEDLAKRVMAALHNWEKDLEEEVTPALAGERFQKAQKEEGRPPTPEAQAEEGKDAAAEQRMEAIAKFHDATTRGDVDFAQSDAESLDDFQVARLYLAAKTIFSRRCARDLLSSHEVNALYVHRKELEPGGWENRMLWQTIFGPSCGTAPGWYWFRGADRSATERELWYLAIRGPDEKVRKNALALLRQADIPIDRQLLGEVDMLSSVMADDSSGVRRGMVEYLAEMGEPEDIPVLTHALEDGDSQVAEAASSALWRVKSRNTPQEAFEDLLNSDDPSPQGFSAIRMNLEVLTSDCLLKALGHGNKNLRRTAVDELARRGELSKEAAYLLLNDEVLTVRETAYRHLIQQGEHFEPDKILHSLSPPSGGEQPSFAFRMGQEEERADPVGVVRELYRSYTYEQLQEAIEWVGSLGHVAYWVLAEEHFEKMVDRIRVDLSDDFESMRQQWEEGVRQSISGIARKELTGKKPALGVLAETVVSKLLDEKIDKALAGANEIADFRKGRFISAALAGLAMHGNEADLPVARRLLRERNPQYYWTVQTQAVKLVARFGDESDVDALIAVAKESYGDTSQLAANAALQLSPGADGAARKLLEQENATLFSIAADSLVATGSAAARGVMEVHLGDENSSNRLKALSCLTQLASRSELEEVLERYMVQDGYYFNVVCELDRALYAPEPFAAAYRRRCQ